MFSPIFLDILFPDSDGDFAFPLWKTETGYSGADTGNIYGSTYTNDDVERLPNLLNWIRSGSTTLKHSERAWDPNCPVNLRRILGPLK